MLPDDGVHGSLGNLITLKTLSALRVFWISDKESEKVSVEVVSLSAAAATRMQDDKNRAKMRDF